MQHTYHGSKGLYLVSSSIRSPCQVAGLLPLKQCRMHSSTVPQRRCLLKPLTSSRMVPAAFADGEQVSENEDIVRSNVAEEVQQEQDKKVAYSGSVLGAIALITGSSVGAGMLAMPAATVASGFVPSAAVMVGSWAVLTLEALLLVEVNLAVSKKLKSRGDNTDCIVSLRAMAEETLGPTGAHLTSSVYLVMSYSLLVAFISKAGEVVDLLTSHNVPASTGGLVFAASMGALVTFGGGKTIDFTNQVLTASLLVLFGGLLVGGAHVAQWDTLIAHNDWGQVGGAIPIIFLSLVFHDLTPYLCKYLGFDKGRIQTAVIAGGSIPLLMFLAWNAVALAAVPSAGEGLQVDGIVDPLRVLIETQGGFASLALEVFSLLAVVTSFIGTTLGLSEHMLSEVRQHIKAISEGGEVPGWAAGSATDGDRCKGLAVSLALIPPSIASFMNPQLFFIASQLAGAYGITLLYGIIPPMMAWQVRHPQEGKHCRVRKPMVPGGKPVLASLASFAAAIELGKFATDSGGLLSGLTNVGTHVQTAANLVITGLASADNITQLGEAFQM